MVDSRYTRQMTLPQVGESGQEKLVQARVLIVGAGGLGNAVLPYLASSGIGTLGVIDGDAVSLCNLHRQVLFSESDIALSKSETACKKLSIQFPAIEFKSYSEFLTGQNALAIFRDYDLIVDATDAIDARFLINDASILTNKPFVHASVYRFQFQVAVFNAYQSGSYRCLYPLSPTNSQSCAEAGVMPTTVAMAGLYQANEVLKFFLKIGQLLTNEMVLVDTLTNRQTHFAYDTQHHDFITPSFFARTYAPIEKIRLEQTKQIGIFLDVRNDGELPFITLENYLRIPLASLAIQLSLVPRNKEIYIFCQSGNRSIDAHHILIENGYTNVYCLHETAAQINQVNSQIS